MNLREVKDKEKKQLPPHFVSLQAIVFFVERDRDLLLNKNPILFSVEDDPKTYSETIKSRDATFWKEAMNDEMNSILSNNTWVLVDLPQGSKPIVVNEYFVRNMPQMKQFLHTKFG